MVAEKNQSLNKAKRALVISTNKNGSDKKTSHQNLIGSTFSQVHIKQ